MEQFVDIRFPVSHADQHRVGTVTLRFSNTLKTTQPFVAFLLLDRALFALVFLPKLLCVPRPTLDIQQAQRRTFHRKSHRVVHDQADDAFLLGANWTQILRRWMRAVIQTRRVLRAEDDLLLCDSLEGRLAMRL